MAVAVAVAAVAVAAVEVMHEGRLSAVVGAGRGGDGPRRAVPKR